MNTEVFEEWVERFLCPVLGSYDDREERSIMVMDNASVYLLQKVADLIQSTGASLLFLALYSLDLNPIENAFSIYKLHLKRNSYLFVHDWIRAHDNAIDVVTADIAIKLFQNAAVPNLSNVMTTAEEKDIHVLVYIVVILIISLI